MGSPLPRAFGPQSGRALSRGKDCRATEPPSASRPIPVTVPSAGARGSRCRIIGGVTAVMVVQAALHASEIAQEDRIGLTIPKIAAKALALILAAIVQGSPHASDQISLARGVTD